MKWQPKSEGFGAALWRSLHLCFYHFFAALSFINSGTQTSQPHPRTRTHCLWPFVSCFTLKLHKYRTLAPFLWTSFKLELAVVINLRIYKNQIQIFIGEVVIMGHQIYPLLIILKRSRKRCISLSQNDPLQTENQLLVSAGLWGKVYSSYPRLYVKLP